ncbi:MAG: hypothetical protein ABI720_11450, partial [Actinomycetes bacterium]
IPEVPDLPAYIRELQDLGRQSGVGFVSLTPIAPVELGGAAVAVGTTGAITPGALAAVNVDMELSGTYFEITKFMNELETSPRYTLVSGYTIVEDETEAEGEPLSSGSPQLNATVNARIYLMPSEADVTALGAESTTPSPAPAP